MTTARIGGFYKKPRKGGIVFKAFLHNTGLFTITGE